MQFNTADVINKVTSVMAGPVDRISVVFENENAELICNGKIITKFECINEPEIIKILNDAFKLYFSSNSTCRRRIYNIRRL